MLVLSLFPHPDDEAFAAGGLLSRFADSGAEVVVVSVTRGDGGTARDGADTSLGERRFAELEASARAMGASEARCLGMTDGDPESWNVTVIEEELDVIIPDVIVTFGADGGYGHVDHVFLHRLVSRSRWANRALYCTFPEGIFTRVHKALRRFRGGSLLSIARGSELGTAAEEPALLRLRLDTETRTRKLAAIAAHESQLLDGDPHSFLHAGFIDPLLHEEWFIPATSDVATKLRTRLEFAE